MKTFNFVHDPILPGIILSMAGGFLDAYTYVGRGGVFANAQTGNMVLFAINAIQGNWNNVVLSGLPILAFSIGVFVSEAIRTAFSSDFPLNYKNMILFMEIIIILIVGFIPYSVSDIFVNMPISFVTSLQYCAFNRLLGFSYATTMCTGNLRSASMAAYAAIAGKKTEAAREAAYLFAIIIAFMGGAFAGGLLTVHFGSHAVWGADILLALSLILLNFRK
jgi:uncharacterized membrane protein YoaK (UPF0700 family)